MLPTHWFIRPNSSGQLLAENRGITELLLWYTEFSKTKSMVSKKLNLVPDFPLKVPPIKSANARLLADNRGFTESFIDLSYNFFQFFMPQNISIENFVIQPHLSLDYAPLDYPPFLRMFVG